MIKEFVDACELAIKALKGKKVGEWLPADGVMVVADEMRDITINLPVAVCSGCKEMVPILGKWKKYCPLCGCYNGGANDEGRKV